MNKEMLTTKDETQSIGNTTIGGNIAILPEQPAITALVSGKFKSLPLQLDYKELYQEILDSLNQIQKEDDISMIVRYHHAHIIALNSMFDDMLCKSALAENLVAKETYTRLALKAQAQCRVTLATLADIKNPNRATFIKQQNNAINQQVNNPAGIEVVKKTENIANELLSEERHEALEFGRKTETSTINPTVETVDSVHRRKN